MENHQPRKRGSTAKRRRGARQKAMQALYQWDFDRNAHDASHIVQQFRDMQNMDKVDVEYFEALFVYATENTAAIDTEIASHMDRNLAELDPIERSVLRICCAELVSRLDAPYKVVVNEAVEISKDFGAEKGYRYINGIADKLAASLRHSEYQRAHPDGNPQAEGSAQVTQSVSETVRAKAGKVKITIKDNSESENSKKPDSQKSADVDKSRMGEKKRSGDAADKAVEKTENLTDKSKDKSGKQG